MFPLKNTEAYIHANGYRSTLGKELAARDAEISEVKSEIQALTNYVNATGAHNLLNLGLFPATYSGAGVTHTINAATGVVTFHRDSPNSANHYYASTESFELKAGTYKFSATYSMSNSGVRVGLLSDAEAIGYLSDTGEFEFTIASDKAINLYLYYPSAQSNDVTISNVMLRLASDAGTDYQPYAKTNVELTQESAGADYTDQSLFTDIDDTAIARTHFEVYKRGNAIYGVFSFDLIRNVTNGEVLFKAPVAPKTDTFFNGTGVGTSDVAKGFVWKNNGNVCSYGSNAAENYIASNVSTFIS